MLKNMFFTGMVAAATTMALAQPVVAEAATLGPSAHLCNSNASAILVDVSGFKARTGSLRVQLYTADATFLDKGKWIERIDLPVGAGSGPMRVCVPVRSAGDYVISVRHDVNGNGKSDRSDGGGLSGNPNMKLVDFLSKRKPRLAAVSFPVGAVTKRVPVTLNYVRGLSFQPVK